MFTELLKQKFIKLSKDKRGNFVIIATIVAPLLLACGGMAIELANQTALKTRFQAASDSVSLVVATRLSNSDLTVAKAEEFGKSLLEAQMANDHSRFSNLDIKPVVEITEMMNGGDSTWEVMVGGTARQDTTPFAVYLNKVTTTSVTVSSVARAGKEYIQDALSMAIVFDVSNSMNWTLPSSPKLTSLEKKLGVPSSHMTVIVDNIGEMIKKYNLTLEHITWIVKNYSNKDCSAMKSRSARIVFLDGIGSSSRNERDANDICHKTTWGQIIGASQKDLLDNIKLVYNASYGTLSRLFALKEAARNLFAQFEKTDPNHLYVRTGAISYNDKVVGRENLKWGTKSANKFIQRARADGYTKSTGAMKWAYDKLKPKRDNDDTESKAHKAKNGDRTPNRFILFMADGENKADENKESSDKNKKNSIEDERTLKHCDNAKKDGIIIYSVAFAAPDRGKILLNDCASSKEHYFEPETASELIAAFESISITSSKMITRLTH